MKKSNKGMTLITIIVAIVVMILLLSTIVISAKGIFDDTKKKQFARELDLVQSSWNTYLARNSGKIDTLQFVDLNITTLVPGSEEQFKSEYKPGGIIHLAIIDLYDIDVENITYGNGTDGLQDRYLVSLTTGKVYYEKGLTIGGQTYYTMTSTNKVETKIESTIPKVTAVAGTSTNSSITINAFATDEGGSGINASSYQYSNDNGVTWTEKTDVTSYIYEGVKGTYKCKVKVENNIGNSIISSAISISTLPLGTITLQSDITTWTNTNVNVTITYPAEVTIKQYSLDGTNWSTYTGVLNISSNTAVYAKGSDEVGNQTAQATLAVANIDKTAPTITASSGAVTTTTIIVNASASDAGSGLKIVSYEYSKDNGVTWTPATNVTSYTFAGLTTLTTYQCKVRVSDNALNITTSVAVGISTI